MKTLRKGWARRKYGRFVDKGSFDPQTIPPWGGEIFAKEFARGGGELSFEQKKRRVSLMINAIQERSGKRRHIRNLRYMQ